MATDLPESAAPAAWIRGPRVRALSALQSQYVLQRNHVGRVAFVRNGMPELLPVHYVYHDHLLYGRTSFGAKSAVWERPTDVVFEIDEPDGLYDWRSVLVRGTLRVLSQHGTRRERAEYWDAVAALRTLIPDAFTERDPTPSRRLLFEIEPAELSGREASTNFLKD